MFMLVSVSEPTLRLARMWREACGAARGTPERERADWQRKH